MFSSRFWTSRMFDSRFWSATGQTAEPFTYSGRLKWVRQVSRELSRMVFRKAEQVR
jgi:hypothetical protein